MIKSEMVLYKYDSNYYISPIYYISIDINVKYIQILYYMYKYHNKLFIKNIPLFSPRLI